METIILTVSIYTYYNYFWQIFQDKNLRRRRRMCFYLNAVSLLITLEL